VPIQDIGRLGIILVVGFAVDCDGALGYRTTRVDPVERGRDQPLVVLIFYDVGVVVYDFWMSCIYGW
jgi:hypothetical protein